MRFPLLLLALLILAGTAAAPFHGDEATQVYMSRDFAYLLNGTWDQVRYRDNPASPTEQHLRLLNGTLNKYLIGLAWHSTGFSVDDLNEQWDWGADWHYNQTNGHAPSAALLWTARWPSALLLVVGLFALYAVGQALAGRRAALLASLYYALNPPLLLNGRRAMMESSFTAFSLLALLAGLLWLRHPTWRRALLLGLFCGLALASKHTALFTVAPVLLICGLSALANRRHRHSVTHLAAAGLTAAAVFLLLNPAWWDDPLARVGEVLRLRQDLLTGQASAFGGYAAFGDQIAGFARQVLVAQPQYYEVSAWATYISDQIAAYETMPWRGISIGGSVAGALALAAVLALGARALWADRTRPAAVRILFLVWALINALAVLALTPLEWQRYYLPVYPAVGLLAASGGDHLYRLVINRRAARAASAAPF